MQDVGAAVGQRTERERRDRIKTGGRQARMPKREHGHSRDDRADRGADSELAHEQDEEVTQAVVAVRRPVDEADHEHDRNGVVEAGLSLERSGKPSSQRRAAQYREHRGAVGRGENRAQQQTLDRRQMEQRRRGEAGNHPGHDRPDDSQAQRRAEHGADIAPPCRETALEQDQRQRDYPDPPGEGVVVERDPPEALGPDRHPQPEHEHKARHAQPPGQQRGGQAPGQHGPGDQEDQPVAHPRSFLGVSAAGRARRGRPARRRSPSPRPSPTTSGRRPSPRATRERRHGAPRVSAAT